MNTQIAQYAVGDTLFRHGDVMLKKTDRPVNSGIPAMTNFLLYKGQNHHHTLAGQFSILDDNGKKFVQILGPSTLDHEEHGPIQIEAMDTALELEIQQEYDHFLEESRNVID